MAVLKYHYFRGHPGLMRPIHIARLGTFPTPYRAGIIPDVHYTLCIILYTRQKLSQELSAGKGNRKNRGISAGTGPCDLGGLYAPKGGFAFLYESNGAICVAIR